MASEKLQWHCFAEVRKYGQSGRLYDIIYSDGNMLMYGGAAALFNRLTSSAPSVGPYDASNAFLGVGNGTTAVSPTQTDLQGASKVRVAMDASYPQLSDGTGSLNNFVVFKSTYTALVAIHAWSEWGLFNAAAAGRMLNRRVQSFGTKPSGQVWTLTVTLSLG